MVMEVQPPHGKQKTGVQKPSILLEFAALDDLPAFRSLIEDHGFNIDELGLWYTRRIGSRTISYEQRTPLMVSALYGSFNVLNYILTSGKVDVNRTSGSDCVSALHCAVAGGSDASSPKIVELLIQSSADVNSVDGNGNRAIDLIPALPSISSGIKKLQFLLSGGGYDGIDDEIVVDRAQFGSFLPQSLNEGSEKKEYPVDTSLPDINNGIYGSDEFRMYSFKIKPCSRAYTHDWTECPFSHPGENARRRDPRKYQYSCVPCPEFRKNGACKKGDECEYAHGVFESWLHPAQYRTRLCKDEVGCSRRVCFFAHKKEELRPVYASTGSAIPSPTISSSTASATSSIGSPVSGSCGADMAGIGRQLSGGMSSPTQVLLSSSSMSTPPMSPKSGGGEGKWANKINGAPNLPSLQLPGSRLRTSLSARDMELELLKLEKQINQQQQRQLMEGMYGSRIGSELGGGSLMSSSPMSQSPVGLQMHHPHLNHIRTSYPPHTGSSLSSSPVARKLSPPRGLGSPNSRSVAAAAMLNDCRAAAFAKRSQSFIDRGVAPLIHGGYANSTMPASPTDCWGPPDGKLDWGIQGEDMNMNSKLRKSASFGFRGNDPHNQNMVAGRKPAVTSSMQSAAFDEPDVSWVSSLVRDVPPSYGEATGVYGPQTQRYGGGHGSGSSGGSQWAEQLYIEREKMVAF